MCVLEVMSEFVCFKQKTAYEMRISDVSSDVCSSDLRYRLPGFGARRRSDRAAGGQFTAVGRDRTAAGGRDRRARTVVGGAATGIGDLPALLADRPARDQKHRVQGKNVYVRLALVSRRLL